MKRVEPNELASDVTAVAERFKVCCEGIGRPATNYRLPHAMALQTAYARVEEDLQTTSARLQRTVIGL
jgi:hypothetical protein